VKTPVYFSPLRSGGGSYEFVRSPLLRKLPEIGEIINEIWGVMLPIRGADTVFRGGLRFSSEGGLVVAIHGGAGSGKTALSLAFGASLAPFGVDTLYVTAEESESDLRMRASGICPWVYKRLNFFPRGTDEWLNIQHMPTTSLEEGYDILEAALEGLALRMENADIASGQLSGAEKPCRYVIVLDGIHDLLTSRENLQAQGEKLGEFRPRLREFISKCRSSRALVILTTGEEWAGDVRLDYMVDVAVSISNDATNDYGRKPDRRIRVTKARFQLCATGTHGVQIAGDKGLRISPQINYQLERRAIWKSRLPDFRTSKIVMRTMLVHSDVQSKAKPKGEDFLSSSETDNSDKHFTVLGNNSVNVPRGSNVFINGQGSGGKAALALKLAIAPAFSSDYVGRSSGGQKSWDRFSHQKREYVLNDSENVLVVSFLYTSEYYDKIFGRLKREIPHESPLKKGELNPRIDVIHLYPGYMRPNDLFNKIEWKLQEGEKLGLPFTSVIIDGIHNVFLQFPELQNYPLFWPQLFSMLRTRPLTTITTHTNLDATTATSKFDSNIETSAGSAFEVRFANAFVDILNRNSNLDDKRSEPLRHALIQQTDYSFEVNPKGNDRNKFEVYVKSAIDQVIPSKPVIWSRELLVFLSDDEQGELALK
jgi:KaiC